MKSKADIKARVKKLLVAELDQRVAEANKRLPHHCVHNLRQPLDTRKTIDGEPNPGYNRITDSRNLPVIQTIGLCGLGKEDPETWNGTICEDPIDAQNCRYHAFEARFTSDEIWGELIDQFQDPEWAAEHLPQAAALAWALDEGELVEDTTRAVVLYAQVEVVEEAADAGLYVGPELPWWKRVILRWLGIDQTVPPLLPAPEEPEEDDEADDDSSVSS